MKISLSLACLLGTVAFTLPLHAAVVFSEGFDSGTLSGWTASDSSYWSIKNASGNNYASSTIKDAGAGQTLSHALGQTLTESWSASVNYDWKWGGSKSGNYGFSTQIVVMEMLDSSGNGYAVQVRQGTGGNVNNAGSLISIYTVTAGTLSGTALVSGTGYDRPGWASVGVASPRFTPVELTWDQSTNTLSAYYNNGSQMVLSASIKNTTYTSFEKLTVLTKGYTNTEEPNIDSILVQTIPEAASLGLMSLGCLALLRRR